MTGPRYSAQPAGPEPEQFGGPGARHRQETLTAAPLRPGRTMVVMLALFGVMVIGGVATTVARMSNPQNEPPAPQPSAPAGPPPVPTYPSFSPPPNIAGWTQIRNQTAGLTYQLPPEWKLADAKAKSLLKDLGNQPLVGIANRSRYQCDGKSFDRGALGGASVLRTKGSADSVAKDFATAWTTSIFSNPGRPAPQLGTPTTVPLSGGPATLVSAAVDTASDGKCLATKGTVTAVVLETPELYKVFVIGVDTAGGPDAPPVPAASEVATIISTLRAN
ncbi:hypothetical protein D5S17_01320 [Pseudonocardiaceae bacterium YIM PH 21723]|nr:hypothetical protein D5S17_01320 [Pseudonocardiaceae bacterium YIM PH 21723]